MNTPEQAYNLITVSGFGKPGIKALADSFKEKMPIASVTHIDGCPWYFALRDPQALIKRVATQIRSVAAPRLIVSHSYGAALALWGVCELDTDEQTDINVVLLDPPINPDVAVAVPPDHAHFALFTRQYINRERLARSYTDQLTGGKCVFGVITVASADDPIIPHAAKKLPGQIDHYDLLVRGHGLGERKVDAVSSLVKDIGLPFSPPLLSQKRNAVG